MADGFVGTNEIRFDAAEEWLHVVESNARHISRLRAAPDASLSGREIYGPADLGGIPDGLAFDELGNLWITLVNGDRQIALTPEGEASRCWTTATLTGYARSTRRSSPPP